MRAYRCLSMKCCSFLLVQLESCFPTYGLRVSPTTYRNKTERLWTLNTLVYSHNICNDRETVDTKHISLFSQYMHPPLYYLLVRDYDISLFDRSIFSKFIYHLNAHMLVVLVFCKELINVYNIFSFEACGINNFYFF